MEFEKISAPSLKDLFVKQLQSRILSGELPAGTQLPPERELARQMQVSRAVVNGGISDLIVGMAAVQAGTLSSADFVAQAKQSGRPWRHKCAGS